MRRSAPAQPASQSQASDDYRLLLSPAFAAMSKITENLFLTGVGGMTRENFARNHIDFVVNITVDAPFWQDVESIRIALEDEASANILLYLDFAVDKIHEAITNRQAHVLVHCVAGVSRSATIVIAYLMKVRRQDLKSAFNHCYSLRPVIRPNNGFMVQLINYEQQLFGRPSSVRMIEADVDGTLIRVPNFFIEDHPRLVLLEVLRVRDNNNNNKSPAAATTQPAGLRTTPGLHQYQTHHQTLAQEPASKLAFNPTKSIATAVAAKAQPMGSSNLQSSSILKSLPGGGVTRKALNLPHQPQSSVKTGGAHPPVALAAPANRKAPWARHTLATSARHKPRAVSNVSSVASSQLPSSSPLGTSMASSVSTSYLSPGRSSMVSSSMSMPSQIVESTSQQVEQQQGAPFQTPHPPQPPSPTQAGSRRAKAKRVPGSQLALTPRSKD